MYHHKRSYSRRDRIAELLQKEIALLIQFKSRDKRLKLITVTEVKINRDMHLADVFITSMQSLQMDNAKEITQLLNESSGYFREQLGKAVYLKHIPALRFHYDYSVSQGAHMDQLIRQAINTDKKPSIK